MPRFTIKDFGTCLNFANTSDVVTVPNRANLQFTTNFTMMAWVKPRSFGGLNLGILFSKGGGFSNGYAITWRNNTGQRTLRFAANNSTYESSSSNIITLGVWQHIAVTFDSAAGSNQIKFYVNGVASGTATLGTALTVDSTQLSIGGDTSRVSDSQMDEVKIFKRTLSPAELSNEYYGISADPTDLSLYHKYDEGSGTTAIDSTGGVSGTITGATYSSDVFMVNRGVAARRQVVRNFGTCLSFNGTNTDVTVTSQAFYNNTSYSVSLWVKAVPQGSARVLALGSSASNNPVWTIDSQSTGKIGFLIRDDGNGTRLNSTTVSTTTVLDGRWHHIVVTDANGALKLYVDGVLDATDFTYTRTGSFTFNRTAVGALVRAVASSWYTGLVDDIRIYNSSILSATGVTNLFYSGVNPSTPTSWYKFDESSGTTANDSGSLAANGTITNATYSSDVFIKLRTVAS